MAAVTVASGQVEVDVVAYGRPATEALAARIAAAKRGHPLDPVTVVVPSNPAGLSVRRLLGGGSLGAAGIANVSFVTPFRLAELLGSVALGDRRPLTNPVLAAAARAVLATEPGIFSEVAAHQATQAALVDLYAELSRALPDTLAGLTRSGRRGAEVVRLVEAVRRRLGDHHDEDDLAVAAERRLAQDAAAARSLGALIWYLPDRVSPAVQSLLRTALREAAPAAVVAGLAGAADADVLVREVCASVGAAIPEQVVLQPVGADRIVAVLDPDEEVRTVIREVMSLAGGGTDLDRIAIFFPTPEPYARTLHEQLDAAGIPHNGPATARLADSVAGRTLLGALALPGTGWGRADVIALLSGGPIRDGDRLAPSGRWDSISRDAGVVGGLDDWKAKLATRGEHLHTERERLEATGASEARLRRLSEDLGAVGELARFVEDLAAELARLDVAPSWAARAAGAQALLERLLGREHHRSHWPTAELDGAGRVDAALARLVVLDQIDPAPAAQVFEQAVRAELDAKGGRIGRFGEGVLVAPLAAAVGLDLDAVFVVGVVEGTCPSFRRDDTLLPDTDRALAAGGELLTRQQRLADQHRAYLAALASSARHRTLLVPRGDLRDRRHRLPSRWLLNGLSDRLGRKVFSSDFGDLPAEEVEVVASYADGISRAVVHGSVTERDVSALLAHAGDPADHPLATGAVGRGFRSLRAREGADFTEWDGNLVGQTLPSPTAGAPASPSKLEMWATCPFRYFLAHVLRLDDRDDPEEITEIGALDRGSLVHEVLETFLREVLDRPGGAPEPAAAWTTDDRERLRAIAEDTFARYEAQGLTGRPLLWRRTKAELLGDLDTFLDHDDRHRAAEGATPVRVEMPFGLEGHDPLVLELPDGRSLTFRGKADRVDKTADGRLVVLDYKTGRDGYAELAGDPVLAGKTLQLGIYAEAAKAQEGDHDVEARYWMTSTRGEFKQRGYLWDAERRARFLDVVGTIVEGVETGTFPAKPGPFDTYWGSHDNCGFCQFDRVCPRDRDDHERAKGDAPELSLLARLALPQVDDGRGAP